MAAVTPRRVYKRALGNDFVYPVSTGTTPARLFEVFIDATPTTDADTIKVTTYVPDAITIKGIASYDMALTKSGSSPTFQNASGSCTFVYRFNTASVGRTFVTLICSDNTESI